MTQRQTLNTHSPDTLDLNSIQGRTTVTVQSDETPEERSHRLAKDRRDPRQYDCTEVDSRAASGLTRGRGSVCRHHRRQRWHSIGTLAGRCCLDRGGTKLLRWQMEPQESQCQSRISSPLAT